MMYGCQIRKEVYFCFDDLKIHMLSLYSLIFNYIDSNQNFNIQQETMSNQENNISFCPVILIEEKKRWS